MTTILSIFSGVLLGLCVVLYVLYRGLRFEHRTLHEKYLLVSDRFNSLEQDLDNQVNTRNEEFLKQFQDNLSVGDIFHAPTDEFVDGFRDTTQKIVSINFEEGHFSSIPTYGGRLPDGFDAWKTTFNCIPKLVWVKRNNNSIKHKFI